MLQSQVDRENPVAAVSIPREPDTAGFEVETFVNVMALKSGLKIAEVPSFESDRVRGESNLRAIPDGWRVLETSLKERFAGTKRDCS